MNRSTKETGRGMSVRKITGLALFTAIVVVLQLVGSFIKFGTFSVSLVLVPIVVGAALYGPLAGAWLGFVFGLVVLLSGDASPFMVVNPLGTIVTVLLKGGLAGYLAGLVYRALVKKVKPWMAVVAAAVVCPVVNTGVFFLGCQLFFMDTINGWAQAIGFESAGKYIIFGMIGANFLFELLFNVVLSPIISRIIRIRKKTDDE
ncbi:MAG: ECF transporter S component [Oscillospiraceae bacterium]|nr:ECF transporter S component [Oscillospiraceae bacterium]